MTTFTDKQVEWAARLLCVADGGSEEGCGRMLKPHCASCLAGARRLLTELERQGVKVMTPPMWPHVKAQTFFDKAPLTPHCVECGAPLTADKEG